MLACTMHRSARVQTDCLLAQPVDSFLCGALKIRLEGLWLLALSPVLSCRKNNGWIQSTDSLTDASPWLQPWGVVTSFPYEATLLLSWASHTTRTIQYSSPLREISSRISTRFMPFFRRWRMAARIV